MKTGFMHRTDIDNSPRLRLVYDCLRRGPHTTLQLLHETGLTDIRTPIAELRFPPNNIPINGRFIRKGVYEYSLGVGQMEMKLNV